MVSLSTGFPTDTEVSWKVIEKTQLNGTASEEGGRPKKSRLSAEQIKNQKTQYFVNHSNPLAFSSQLGL